jgi:hypothetical protein
MTQRLFPYATQKMLLVEKLLVLFVQEAVPTEDVASAPLLPTATQRLLPYASPRISFAVRIAVRDVHAVPVVDVEFAPDCPPIIHKLFPYATAKISTLPDSAVPTVVQDPVPEVEDAAVPPVPTATNTPPSEATAFSVTAVPVAVPYVHVCPPFAGAKEVRSVSAARRIAEFFKTAAVPLEVMVRIGPSLALRNS